MTNTNDTACPSCGAIGYIRWDANNSTYSCYICDSVTPPAYAPQESAAVPYQVQITPNKEMASDFLDPNVMDYDLDSDDNIFEDDPFAGLPDWEPNDVVGEDPEALIEPVYQDSPSSSVGPIMTTTKQKKGELECSRCGANRTQRGEKIKRLYGANKDICLICHRSPLPESLAVAPAAPEPAIATRTTRAGFVLFDLQGKYIGRFSSQKELAQKATGLVGFRAFRLQPLKATMTVKFED